MISYYGMTSVMYPSKLTARYPEKDCVDLKELLSVRSEDWCYFNLTQCGHSRKIKSFEVTVIEAKGIKVGWVEEETVNTCDLDNDEAIIGDAEGSVALDPYLSGITIDGTLKRVEGLELKDGLIIRTEDFGNRWYIDGRLVASDDKSDSALLVKSENSYPYSDSYHTYYRHPVIFINGEFLVSDIKYTPGI